MHRIMRTKLSTVLLPPLLLFVCLAFYIRTWIPVSDGEQQLDTEDDNNWKSLCIGNNLAVPSPLTDGLIMNNNLPPNQWQPFDTNREKDNDRRIFFHETTGRMGLTMKQTCVIESAAKHNPHRPVHLFVRPMSVACDADHSQLDDSLLNPLWLDILSNYRNVKPILLNENRYFSGSKLENWYKKGEWRKSPHETYHLSDYVRVLTLHKGGGLYLDLDVLVLKPLNETIFRNFISYEDTFALLSSIGSSVMHLERGHWLPSEMMNLLSQEYDPQDFAYHGSQVVNAVMQSMCVKSPDDAYFNWCRDVRFLGSRFFFPVERPFSNVFYQTSKDPLGAGYLKRIIKSYGAHLWSSMASGQTPLNLDSDDQVFSVLARVICPLTFAKASQFNSI